ncbi:MAG TPA: bifunctional aspartate kinase/homoserine dehydrogenase I, partial [Acidobacteriota bacterium]|nr:bifunctional aspartate kinase/homoserine dehydrogenase I [Acidobacteriota bacterium]
MKVMKFGGSSVGTPDRIRGVIDIVQDALRTQSVAVVISACQGVTDMLIETATLASKGRADYMQNVEDLIKRHRDCVPALISVRRQGSVLGAIGVRTQEMEDVLHGVFLVKELSLRTLDFVMSFGELLAAYIISEAFRDRGIDAEFLDARKVVRTDARFGSALVDFEVSDQNIRAYFAEHPALQVITGFIGATSNDETTTLGRGGSDYTAAIFGAALKVSEIEIWTDVDGVMTADPRKVKRAFPIESMSYEEAMEMSHFGAKIIHPPTMQPARTLKIPLHIKNTFQPKSRGTLITDRSQPSESVIKGLSSIPHVSLLTVQGSGMIGIAGISNRLFGALARKGISVILITQASSEHSICVAVDPRAAAEAKHAIEEEFSLEILAGLIDEVVSEPELAIVAIVGENMRHTPGISGRLFQSLGRHGINVVAIAQGSSELNISVVIQKSDETRALNAVHDTFFLPGLRTIHVYLAGVGLIGGTLLEQVRDHRDKLMKDHALEIQINGIFNSRRMLLSENGLDLQKWKESLQHSEQALELPALISAMKNWPGSVFVDCTNSDKIGDWYASVFDAGIPIVTANKKPVAGPYSLYRKILSVARPGFLYETTVGAGLPVISTLNDLLNSGDEVRRIEAILSGTLSFLFNTFTSGTSFSSILREAQKRGYTEPDPREDLNGMDVARKLLILARVLGFPLEIENVNVENLVPPSCRQAQSVDEFLDLLQKEDDVFEKHRADAARQGKALRYIARLESGKASVSLQAVGPDHPFY